MRRAVYQALLKAPFRIASGLSTAAGIVGTFWPQEVKAVIGEGIPVQPIGIALLAASVIYFALLWLLKPGEGNEGGGTTITTSGPNSPGFGSVGGNVTITHHHAPAATQPVKSPHGSSRYTSENLDALARVMRAGPYRGNLENGDLTGLLRRPSAADIVLRRMREQRGRCPEMPIWQALHKIAGRIGDTDEENGFPEAQRQFRQAALEGRVDVWGQQDIPPAHMTDERHRDVWTRIEADHWNEYKLARAASFEALQERPHTKEEELGRHGGRYWNLKVRPEDIRHRWPKPPRTTNDGKP